MTLTGLKHPLPAFLEANHDPAGGIFTIGAFSPADNVLTDQVDDADETLNVYKGAIGSILFIEVMRDVDKTSGPSVYNFKKRLAPHELVHQFGLKGDTPNFGIMTAEDNNIRLVPRHIPVIRWRVASPGEPNF